MIKRNKHMHWRRYKMKRLRWIMYKITMIIVISLLLAGCSLIPEEITHTAEIIRPVQVTEVKQETKDVSVSYLGVAVVNDERFIFSEQTGNVKTINNVVGQPVKKGDTILDILTSGDKSIEIQSDSDGLLKSILVKEDDQIDIGDPVGTMTTYNHRITFGLTSEDVKKVEIGTKAAIKLGQLETMGRVCLISPYPDEVTRTFTAQIEMIDTYEQEDYIVGDIAEIQLILGEAQGIYLDMKHVHHDETPFVYLLDANNLVKIQPITIQGESENNIRVEGLQEGDQVIHAGTVGLKEGQQVKIVGDEGEGANE